MIRVVMMGAAGRMGRDNISLFNEDNDIRIVGAIEQPDAKQIGMDAGIVAGIEGIGVIISSRLEEVIDGSDVVVDFTTRETSLRTLEIAVEHKKPVVIGTTGFSQEQRAAVQEYSKKIAILMSPNMSLGINILFLLAKKTARLLGKKYNVEILEIHHNLKKDAPSGTAMKLGRIISEEQGKKLEDVGVFGEEGVSCDIR